MSLRQPPALAAWLLDRLGYTRQNAALAGDLLEEYRSGRSPAWFWRQTLMVIVNGIGRNAVVLQSYLKAVVAGFGAQVPVALALWWFHSPPQVHGFVWGTLAALVVLSGFVGMAVVKRSIAGPPGTDLKLLVIAGASGSQNRPAMVALVLLDTFATYLLRYCICALFVPRLSLAELIYTEVVWLFLLDLTPALLRVPSAARVTAAEAPAGAGRFQEPPAYPPQEACLLVSSAEGKTTLLRPETVVESVFTAADEELAATLFQHAAPRELLRRAVWLGCARSYLTVLADPSASPAISLPELAYLVEEAARGATPTKIHYAD